MIKIQEMGKEEENEENTENGVETRNKEKGKKGEDIG